MKMQVFEPPMCCTSGVCGPNFDPTLPTFAADLEWLKGQGIQVERFNLAQQPHEFVNNTIISSIMSSQGNDGLPIILVDGTLKSSGRYPTRSELAALADLPATPDNAAPSCCCSGQSSNSSRSKCC